ncbi:MAG: gluconate 2-dehydrogenase subunit 3 family protein [Burkholderiales bacterium]
MTDENLAGDAQRERREFVKRSGAAMAGMRLVATGGALAPASPAGSQSLSALSPHEARVLLRLCRDIYPHDTLPDEIYEKVVAGFDASASKDAEAAAAIAEGLKELEVHSQRLHGRDYLAVAGEADRVSVLQRIESTAFFQTVRGSLITGIYNNPEVWKILGYEGPSAQLGGYLQRGFNDLDWL